MPLPPAVPISSGSIRPRPARPTRTRWRSTCSPRRACDRGEAAVGDHRVLPARAKGAVAVATIVAVAGIGIGLSTEPSAGAFPGARRRAVNPTAPPARVPLDAAVAARARAQAEQALRAYQA